MPLDGLVYYIVYSSVAKTPSQGFGHTLNTIEPNFGEHGFEQHPRL